MLKFCAELAAANKVLGSTSISLISIFSHWHVCRNSPVDGVDERVDTAVAHGQPEKEFFKYVFSRLRSLNPPV